MGTTFWSSLRLLKRLYESDLRIEHIAAQAERTVVVSWGHHNVVDLVILVKADGIVAIGEIPEGEIHADRPAEQTAIP